jgi:hypothetical protein
MQKILCAAILVPDGKIHDSQPENIQTGFVITGYRHGNCYATAKAMNYIKIMSISDIQGFITNDNLFVERREAFDIAYKAKQLIVHRHPCSKCNDVSYCDINLCVNCKCKTDICKDNDCKFMYCTKKEELYSEDLY